MKPVEIFWDDLPYVVLAIAVVGTWWRYRYDKFGWTTRSSQIYESRLLSIANPLFHFGSLAVIMGHVLGLFVPESWTRAV
jgi:nitrate reductase gamma subunit